VLHWLVGGKVARVFATGGNNVLKDRDTIDHAALAIEYENGVKHILYRTATPIDDRTSIICQFVARNDDPDPERQETIAELDRMVQNEDRQILERIDPNFPIDLNSEFHTRADRMTVEYRRVLAELAGETSMVRPDREWIRSRPEEPRGPVEDGGGAEQG